MKSFLILLLSFFIIPSFVLADGGLSTIFTGIVKSGNYQTTTKENFTIIINEQQKQCYFTLGNISAIVANNTCASRGDYFFCVEKINRSDKFDIERFDWIYQAKIKISKSVPEISIKKELPRSTLELNETISLKLKITNNGLIAARDVRVTDQYPEKIVNVVSSIGCRVEGNALKWQGELGPAESFECSLFLKGIAPGEGESRAEVIYYEGQLSKSVNAKQALKVKPFLITVNQTLRPVQLEVGSVAQFNIMLKPELSLDLSLFRVSFPEGVRVISAPSQFSARQNLYDYSGRLEGVTRFNFTLRMDYMGNFTILEEITLSQGQVKQSARRGLNFSVRGNKLAIGQASPLIKGGKGEFLIVNPSQTTFKNINVSFGYDNNSFSRIFQEIEGKRHIPVEFEYSGNSRVVRINVKINYETLQGQRLQLEDVISFNTTSGGSAQVSSTSTTVKGGSTATGTAQTVAKKSEGNNSVFLYVIGGLSFLLLVLILITRQMHKVLG